MDENATVFHGSKNIFIFAVQFFSKSNTVMFVSSHKIHFRILLHNKLMKIKQSASYISEAKGVILKNSSCVVRCKSL